MTNDPKKQIVDWSKVAQQNKVKKTSSKSMITKLNEGINLIGVEISERKKLSGYETFEKSKQD